MSTSRSVSFRSSPSFLGLGLVLVVAAALLVFRQIHLPSLPARIVHPSPLPAAQNTRSAATGVREALRPATAASFATPPTQSALPLRAVIHANLERLRLRQTGDDATRDEVTAELLALLTDENVGTIVRGLDQNERSTEFGTTALLRWLVTEPGQSAAWLAHQGGTTVEQGAVIGRQLVGSPAALATLCDALPEGNWRQAVLTGAALQAADKDPRTAIEIANRMPVGPDQTGAYETIAYAWAVADPVAAGKWIEAVTDTSLRQQLLATGAKALASTDPDLAATWLASAVKSGAVLNDTALTVVEAWSAKDPAAAAAWVRDFPTNAPREEAIQLVLQQWLKSNPAAANAWLTQLPDRAKIVAQLESNAAEDATPKD